MPPGDPGWSVLEALRAESELERCPAAREPLEPETAAELYSAIADVREALGRLVEASTEGRRQINGTQSRFVRRCPVP